MNYIKYIFSIIFISGFINPANCQIQIGKEINSIDTLEYFNREISMSADGKTVAIGITVLGIGKVRIYKYLNEQWSLIGQEIISDYQDDGFGFSVALSDDGNRVIIGCYGFNSLLQNFVKVYDLINSEWSQVGETILGGSGDTYFGQCVSISGPGNIIAISDPSYPSLIKGFGLIKIYEEIDGVWKQLANSIIGQEGKQAYGGHISLSYDGKTLATSSYSLNINDKNSEWISVFKLNNNTWEQIGSNINSNPGNTLFGWSVSLSSDGNSIAVGAPGSLTEIEPCYVSIYNFNGTNWMQKGQNIEGCLDEFFGWIVSLSGNGQRVAIASANNNICPVRIFDLVGDQWLQFGNSFKNKRVFSNLGRSMDLSRDGNTIAVSSEFGGGFVQINDITDITINTNTAECICLKDTVPINEIILYPNPTTGKLYVKGIDIAKNSKIIVYDLLGRTFNLIISNANEIDISGLVPGYYILDFSGKRFKVVKIDY